MPARGGKNTRINTPLCSVSPLLYSGPRLPVTPCCVNTKWQKCSLEFPLNKANTVTFLSCIPLFSILLSLLLVIVVFADAQTTLWDSLGLSDPLTFLNRRCSLLQAFEKIWDASFPHLLCPFVGLDDLVGLWPMTFNCPLCRSIKYLNLTFWCLIACHWWWDCVHSCTGAIRWYETYESISVRCKGRLKG